MCQKQFTQQSNLKQHLLIHLGAKPFLCRHQGCRAAFTTKQCLQVHYRKVHHYNDLNMPVIEKVKLDEYISAVSSTSTTKVSTVTSANNTSDDSSTHSGEFFSLLPHLPPPATCDHLLPDVS